jgi:hypothetical protein
MVVARHVLKDNVLVSTRTSPVLNSVEQRRNRYNMI